MSIMLKYHDVYYIKPSHTIGMGNFTSEYTRLLHIFSRYSCAANRSRRYYEVMTIEIILVVSHSILDGFG